MNAHGQQKYQVRLDHGVAGAARIASGAHVVVVVDVLDGHGTLTRDETVRAVVGLPEVAHGADVLVVTGSGAAGEVARHVVERQARQGDRALVAVVAAGAVEAGGFRPAVEDQLAAGAVVDALAAVGIDFSSPEAAVACAAAGALSRASSHLLTASASAAELVATDRGDVVDAARASSFRDSSSSARASSSGGGGGGAAVAVARPGSVEEFTRSA